MTFKRAFPLIVILAVAGLSGTVRAQDLPDPVFGTVPFDRWMQGRDVVQIPWKMTIAPPVLDNHQRLRVTISVGVEGREISKRVAKGELRMLVQFNDEEGHSYEDHSTVELKELTAKSKQSDLLFSHDAFVRPGDYRVGVALVHTGTREHSFAKRQLHVDELKDDPLPASWSVLAPVEILSQNAGPEAWFLPYTSGRLNLPIPSSHPMSVEVLMNLPSEEASSNFYRQYMSSLLPALKVLSQLGVRNGSLSLAILDLTRRKVVFEQSQARDLDWYELRAALGGSNPNVIDVHSLANKTKGVEFFLSEIGRRIQAPVPKSESETASALHAIIVLSSSMTFPRGTDMHPIQLDEAPDCPLYYIRYHAPPERRVLTVAGATINQIPSNRVMLGGPSSGGNRNSRATVPEATAPTTTTVETYATEEPDALEHTLKPVKPHLFDVYSADQFRKALAAIIDDLTRK